MVKIVGDVNGDGSVNLQDTIAIVQVITGQTPDSILKMANADDDGRIEVNEAIMRLRKLGS